MTEQTRLDDGSTSVDRTVAEVAERFFTAVERGAIDEIRELYDADVVVWHNYDRIEQDKDTNLRSLEWIGRRFGGVRYVDVQRELTEDGFWQRHVAVMGAGEDALEVPAAIRVVVDGGRIVRIDEYLDPAPVNAAILQWDRRG